MKTAKRAAKKKTPGTLLRKPQDALQLDKMEIAAKRHKRRKTIQFLCFLCLFAAQDPVLYLAAWSVTVKKHRPLVNKLALAQHRRLRQRATKLLRGNEVRTVSIKCN